MHARNLGSFTLLPLLVLLAGPPALLAQPPAGAPMLSQDQAHALVRRALANELHAIEDQDHPMRFTLLKSSPRLSTVKKIIETSNGAVARLISVNGEPLSPAAEQKEQARLTGLLNDPSLQTSRKQREDNDVSRALKVLRALPNAFLYQYAGPGESSDGPVEKFTFKPNPAFNPADMELHVLTAMSGQLWINPFAERAVHLEGRLEHGVDFGWGILGHLNKGGWITIDQANVAGDQWRTVRLQLKMSGRVLFFSKNYDTLEEQSHYQRVPNGLDYREAIKMLRADP